MAATFGFAFLAGIVSILSPCVLPLVPLVLGSALSNHRFGPAALAGGLALSFTGVGLFVATIGYALNIDGSAFRIAAAVVMVLVGVVLLMPTLQVRFATVSGPVGNWAEERFGGSVNAGLAGQFGVGLLLGIVWSPCVGPTLGAASMMAAQGTNLTEVTGAMLLFGIGAAIPLLVLGSLSRKTIQRVRGGLMDVGKKAKLAMGLTLVLFGLSILSGTDKRIETVLVDVSPAWLTTFSTRF
jgi:cytochrome c biogenesis protein CcdA